jgi:hypothetical protein
LIVGPATPAANTISLVAEATARHPRRGRHRARTRRWPTAPSPRRPSRTIHVARGRLAPTSRPSGQADPGPSVATRAIAVPRTTGVSTPAAWPGPSAEQPPPHGDDPGAGRWCRTTSATRPWRSIHPLSEPPTRAGSGRHMQVGSIATYSPGRSATSDPRSSLGALCAPRRLFAGQTNSDGSPYTPGCQSPDMTDTPSSGRIVIEWKRVGDMPDEPGQARASGAPGRGCLAPARRNCQPVLVLVPLGRNEREPGAAACRCGRRVNTGLVVRAL